MPRYRVMIDGKSVLLEGDHPPTEDEARQAITEHAAAPKPAAGMTAGHAVMETVRGAGSELKDQGEGVVEMAKNIGHSIMEDPTRILNPAGITQDLAMKSARGQLMSGAAFDPTSLDPTGAAKIIKSNENLPRKIGRGLVVGGELLLPKGLSMLKNMSKAGEIGEAAKAAEGAGPLKASGIVTGTKFGLPEQAAVPEVPPGAPGPRVVTSSSKGSVRTMPGAEGTPGVPGVPAGPTPITPVGPRFTFGRAITPSPAAAVSGSAEVPRNISSPGVVGPNQFSMSVAGRTAGVVPEAAGESAANAAMKSEAEAEAAAAGRTAPPGREPVYGGVEQRSPTRVTGAAEDKAYKLVRQKLQEKAAMERAKAALITKAPTKASAPVAAPEPVTTMPLAAEGDVPPVIQGAIPDPGPVGAEKGVLEGFTRQPTTPLSAMVEKYGKAGAAQRAGMSVEELEVRLEAGNDPAKLAKGLRDKLGAEKAARALGMKADEVRKASGGGPSKLPQKAVDAIKAAAEKEKAATGSVSPQTQTLLDRIKSEGGAVKTSALLAGGGAVTGAVIGGGLPAKDSDDRMGHVIMGGMAGLGAGLAPSLLKSGAFKSAAKYVGAARREGFLTGTAIPKNMMTAAGAPVRAAFENTGSSRFAPMKEMFDPVTNAKRWWEHMKVPNANSNYPNSVHFGKRGQYLQPTRWIGAIDDTARDALVRGGVAQPNIDRYLLTANRNVFEKLAEVSPEAAKVGKAAFPFQRVPTNVFMEGIGELGHTLLKTPDGRTALNLLQTGGGYALGKWAGNDPKKRMIVGVLLAATGPNAVMSTIGAAKGAGVQGFGVGALGGLSPIPEQALDPSNWTAKNGFGMKPAAISMIKRLSGK